MVQADATSLRDPALSDASTGQLVLQIRGSHRDGQILRLNSPKCTIGSGRKCTLRLLSRGVQPLHCLILRGRDATVVRRWGPDTRLNGQAFSDARLSPGDRLTIGSVELEVLQTTAPTLSSQVAQNPRSSEFSKNADTAARLGLANRQGRRRTRAVVAQLRTARHEIARLEARWTAQQQEQQHAEKEHEALNRRLATLQEEKDTLEEQCRAHEAERETSEQNQQFWKSQSAEIESERNRLESQRQEWEQERAKWNAEREKEQRQIEQQLADVRAERTQLQTERDSLDQRRELDSRCNAEREQADASRQAWERQKAEWDAECKELEQDIESRRADLDASQARLQGEREALDRQRREHDAKRETLEREQRDWQVQLDEAKADREQVDASRQAWEREKVEWDAKCEEREQDIERRLAEVDASQSQLRNEREALDQQRRDHDAKREAFAREQDEWQAQFGEAKAELEKAETLRRQTEEDRDRRTAEFQERERQIERRLADLDVREARLETAQREFDDQRRRWEAQREAQLEAERETRLEAELEKQREAEAARLIRSDAAPVDVSEILGRAGMASVAFDDEPETASMKVSPVETRKTPPASAHENHEEQSIADYMAGLMRRIRSTEEEPSAPASRVAEPTPSPQPAQEERPAPPVQQGPVELSPRRAAPENAESLSAMRELAAASAHSAIDRHAKKKHRDAVRDKLIVALVALFCGASLITAWATVGTTVMSYYIGLLALLVAVIWAVRYAVLSGRMVRNKSGSWDWKSPRRKSPRRKLTEDGLPFSDADPDDTESGNARR